MTDGDVDDNDLDRGAADDDLEDTPTDNNVVLKDNKPACWCARVPYVQKTPSFLGSNCVS